MLFNLRLQELLQEFAREIYFNFSSAVSYLYSAYE